MSACPQCNRDVPIVDAVQWCDFCGCPVERKETPPMTTPTDRNINQARGTFDDDGRMILCTKCWNSGDFDRVPSGWVCCKCGYHAGPVDPLTDEQRKHWNAVLHGENDDEE